MSNDKSLTGVWHGVYSYPDFLEPVYYVATLIGFGQSFTGTTHEAAEGRSGAPLRSFAALSGSVEGSDVSFLKTYDGSAGRRHSINYEGLLSADRMEIEGTWTLPGDWSGRFIMIRNQGASEKIVRQAFERVD
jgi:hypothetical protein